MKDLIHIPEPRLLFRHNQATEDPRDGLTLFGPLDESKPYGIKAGVIGTETGIKCFERWVEWVQCPVFNATPLQGRPPFPGFETVFRSRWNTKPLLSLTVSRVGEARRVPPSLSSPMYTSFRTCDFTTASRFAS